MIEMIINEDDQTQSITRNYQLSRLKYSKKMKILKSIKPDIYDKEKIKADKLLEEVEKVMKIKKHLADMEYAEKSLEFQQKSQREETGGDIEFLLAKDTKKLPPKMVLHPLYEDYDHI